MAKREISSTLRNLKFMQRSALKEEKKKIDDDDDDDNANFTPSPVLVVITDWDPQPRALLGRLSFQSFNPSIEKLNEEESITGGKTDASPTGSSGNGGRMSFRSPGNKWRLEKETESQEGVSEEQKHPSKSPRSSDKPSPSNKKGNGFKKPKSWQPKPQTKL
ncbi:hypothetical protein Bca52824_036254 [Brassica carinata]|uniref:Uncharacterized protein n=1 Tax=Brassica carinata TaxID=52824 RepID=A0A8X7S4J3_BRACI|nr:hypothetical protein Bca52824_036254 [Brassica carinata]